MEASRPENDLPNRMAHLDITENDETNTEAEEDRSTKSRGSSKRKTPVVIKGPNLKIKMKPDKYIPTENIYPKSMSSLYRMRADRFVSQNLETIYEESNTLNEEADVLMGRIKIERHLPLHLFTTYNKVNEKTKYRHAKIMKVFGNKSFLNRKEVPMHIFLDAMKCLE